MAKTQEHADHLISGASNALTASPMPPLLALELAKVICMANIAKGLQDIRNCLEQAEEDRKAKEQEKEISERGPKAWAAALQVAEPGQSFQVNGHEHYFCSGEFAKRQAGEVEAQPETPAIQRAG